MSLLKKTCDFCVYQERTQTEVRKKMQTWGAENDSIEETITWLIEENYLNEGRFAKQYAGGKFRIKKWGKRKILFQLRSKGLSDNCIEEAMAEIDDEDYKDCIAYLIEKKRGELPKGLSTFLANKKVVDYLQMKGYDYGDIKLVMQEKVI